MISPQDKNALRDGWWVDRTIYNSEEIMQLEKERIFYKTWHYACFTSDLKNPGDYWSMSIVDQPVLIVRGRDNELRAFFNACTHRGAVLNNHRCGNERLFKCMYHAWAFNLEGELVGVPYEEGYGPDFDKKKLGLVPARVETFGDLVFVTINAEAPPLRDFLGGMVQRLEHYVNGIEVVGRNSWTYEGNWKLWHENFRDNYHPQFTHRLINDNDPHYADRGGNWGVAPGHSVLRWISNGPNERSLREGMHRHSGIDFPEGQDFQRHDRQGEVLAIFPNMDLQPGSPEHGFVGSRDGFLQTVTPITPHKARIDIIVYSSTADTPQVRNTVLENLAWSQGSWGTVSADDTEAAYRCQQGLAGIGTQFSPFTRGPKLSSKGGLDSEGYDARDEYSLREFYRVYNLYMDGDNRAPWAVAAE